MSVCGCSSPGGGGAGRGGAPPRRDGPGGRLLRPAVRLSSSTPPYLPPSFRNYDRDIAPLLDDRPRLVSCDPIHQAYFTVKMQEGVVASSYNPGDNFYISAEKVLPLQRFLPQPKGAKILQLPSSPPRTAMTA